MTRKPYKLKLTKLEFLSSVDAPAQGDGARALLLKRDGDRFEMRARVSKLDDSLGLVFGYAFASSLDGGTTPHVDVQDDWIDADFLKVAAEFMEAGGKTDVNHDFADDGRIVFAWPLLPDINEAMGIKSNVVGLAVAVKPSAETYAKFKTGELTGFSIAGTGVREPIEHAKRERVAKTSLYTNEVDGHAHAITVYDDGSLFVQYATSEGSEYSHSHGIVRDDSGALTILADSGHTHELAVAEPDMAFEEALLAVLADASDDDIAELGMLAALLHAENGVGKSRFSRLSDKLAERGAEDPDALAAYIGRKKYGAEEFAAMAARGRRKKSTRSPAMPQAGRNTREKPTMATEQDKQIADLEKQVARLTKITKLADTHRAHFDALRADEQDAFLAKSDAERDEIVKAACEVVYTCEDGTKIYKRDGELALRLAKQADEARKIAKAEAAAREEVELAKRAREILHGLAGSDEVHKALLRAVEGISDQSLRNGAIETLKSARTFASVAGHAPGAGGQDAPEVAIANPQGEWDAEIEKLMKEHRIDRYKATEMLAKTARGVQLFAAITKHVKNAK